VAASGIRGLLRKKLVLFKTKTYGKDGCRPRLCAYQRLVGLKFPVVVSDMTTPSAEARHREAHDEG